MHLRDVNQNFSSRTVQFHSSVMDQKPAQAMFALLQSLNQDKASDFPRIFDESSLEEALFQKVDIAFSQKKKDKF